MLMMKGLLLLNVNNTVLHFFLSKRRSKRVRNHQNGSKRRPTRVKNLNIRSSGWARREGRELSPRTKDNSEV